MSSPTYGQLIDQTLTYLHGHTADLEQLTALTQDITSGDTQFTVEDATQVTRGLIEIGDELLWIKRVDQSANTVYTTAFGRGFRETDPASHLNGAMIINNPRFPRQAVATAIAETLLAVYPDLFAVKKDETQTTNPVVKTYQIPADCDAILDLTYQAIGPSKTWVTVRRWDLDTNADTTIFTTGKAVDIVDPMAPGRTIKVIYMAKPTMFVNEASDIASTGLPDSVQDVLVYGACYRLLANLEAARLQTAAVEQSERSQIVPPGSASAASKYYFALYQQALQREGLRLQKFFPTRSHLVR